MKKSIALLCLCLVSLLEKPAFPQSMLSAPTVIVAQRYADINSAIAAAVTAAGGGQATVWIGVATSTTGSVTIAANINFEFSGTGSIVVGSGHTLTYNGSTVGWPSRQLVSGVGSFVFGAGASGTARPQWWGGAANGTNNFTIPLRKTLTAVSGASAIKTVMLDDGIYVVNYETVSGSWVGVPAGVTVRCGGYGSEIRANPASLAEGEVGTLLAIEGSNVAIENCRINGNKAAISGLTTYGSVGIRVSAAASNVTIVHPWIHDLPASAATEAAGILTNTSGAVSGVRILDGETWANNGTGLLVNGDYEQARNTASVEVAGLYTHDNTWHGVRVLGARDVQMKGLRSDNNTLDCVSIEFALRVSVSGELSRCRNGLMVKGDSAEITTDATVWGNNKTGSSRGQVALGVGTWGTGQNTTALPRDVDVRRAVLQPTPGDYAIWAEHDAAVTTYSDTGTFSVAGNVITRSAGSWAAGLLPGQVVELGGFAAVNNIRVRITEKTATELTIDPLYSVLVTDTGTGDETVMSTFESIPQHVTVGEGVTFRVEDFADATTIAAVTPIFIHDPSRGGVTMAQPPLYWLPSTGMSLSAYAGSGNQSPDAVTLTGTTNTSTLSSASVLEPYGTYLLRLRYKATATGKAHDWRMYAYDGTVLANSLRLTGDSTLSTSQWREADTLVTVGSNPAHVRFALLTSATSPLDVDWVTVTRVSEGASRATTVTTPIEMQGWLTAAAQTLDLGVIPAHCMLQNITVYTSVLFDSSGTDTVTIGYTGNTTAYFAGIDVDALGTFQAVVGSYENVARDLHAYYVNGGGEPTTGRALVTVRCVPVTVTP